MPDDHDDHVDDDDDDPFLWLEDVEGDEALAWVRRQNERAESEVFADELFVRLRDETLDVLEADDRIPMPARHGDAVHNFWTDRHHRRGLLRRARWDDYLDEREQWETVIDFDALGADEGQSWVFQGSNTRRPDRTRALIELSPGGSDASTTREFDLVTKRFVPPEEGGFVRPLSKGSLRWIDDDTVYVATDFGPGTMTDSGYPRTVRRWVRGTPLESAELVFEGEQGDVSVGGWVDTLEGFRHHCFSRHLDFYTARWWILRDSELVEIDVPIDAEVGVREHWITIAPRFEWTVGDRAFPGGSLLVADLESYLAGDRSSLEVVFEPTATASLSAYRWTRHHLVLSVLEDVRDRVEVATPSEGGWTRRPLAGQPDVWSVAAGPVDADADDDLLLSGEDFVTPATLYLTSVDATEPRVLRQAVSRFDADGLAITQHFATSADGTRIPYFVVGPDGGHDAPAPTLLGGYGGFEVARQPTYAGVLGRSWLTAGGTYVLANIRGGGEYGPAWHQAGLREKRPRVYEDFEAVARDLIDRGVTTAPQLGCIGGSNGGLLVGNMYVRSPELWGAIVCQVPLLDMRRYHRLLAGASWMAEYGNPDVPEDWAFLRTYSPYQLVRPDQPYPPLLLTTSTRDDRVHPGHARKMAARLLDLGYDVTYWENIEGGHGGAADATQAAVMSALSYTFLQRHLMAPS
jgi:prolyl oligopeptidase